jgi:hypothetical protein
VLFPPIGSFKTHRSDIDSRFSKGKGRVACWDCSWCMMGTRSAHDPKGRVRALLTCSPRPQKVGLVRPENISLRWRSMYIAKTPDPPPVRFMAGPLQAAAQASSSSSGPPKEPPGPYPKVPRQKPPPPPSGPAPAPGERAPPIPGPPAKLPPSPGLDFRVRQPPGPPLRGSVRFEAPATTSDDAPAKRTKRQEREIRALTLMRSYRYWTEDDTQAMPSIGPLFLVSPPPQDTACPLRFVHRGGNPALRVMAGWGIGVQRGMWEWSWETEFGIRHPRPRQLWRSPDRQAVGIWRGERPLWPSRLAQFPVPVALGSPSWPWQAPAPCCPP